MSIIKEMRSSTQFTNTEQQIVNYILKNPEEMANMTASHLAEVTYASPASIIRMCKKIHTSGFIEFKKKFLDDLRFNQYTYLTPVFNTEDSTFTTINKMTILKMMALQEMNENLDYNQIERILNKISQANQIDIFASSEHLYIAKEFAYYLRTLGINALIYTSTNQRYAQAVMADHRHVAFIINQSGQTQKYLNITETLLQNKVFCIGICENLYSPLVSKTNEAVIIKGQNISKTMTNIMFNFNLKSYLDYLFVLLFTTNDDHFEEKNAMLNAFIRTFENNSR